MAIKTVLLGKMRGEGWVFQPEANVRYYLPKGDYKFLVVKSANATGEIGIIPSAGDHYSSSSDFYATRRGVEWVKFSGDIWRVAIAPGATMDKAPRTTPAPSTGNT